MKKYTITDGTVGAVILPEKGATVVSLTKNDVEFFFHNEENLNSPERPRCGNPFLFPTFGRMQEETYTYNGQNYPMPIHGFAHTSIWQVESYQEDSLVLTLSPTDLIRKMYPFDFLVRLTYTIADSALTITQEYCNNGTELMPYAFGFHPYYLLEKLEHAAVTAQADVRIDFASGKMVPFGTGIIRLEEPETAPEIGAALAGLQSPVILEIPEEHRKITMEFSPDFPQLVLWHPQNAPFLCVEPINGSPNGFNTGNHLTLAGGETKTVTLTIRPEQI